MRRNVVKQEYSNNRSQRMVHIDMLRLIAIFFVIFNHTGEKGFLLFAETAHPLPRVLYMSFSILCKIAVPLFFMISGALLLKKEESIRVLFRKRILRILLVLVLASIPYFFWLCREDGLDFFTFIYSHNATTALWYLYSYIGFLLMLPFLRRVVCTMTEREYIYLFLGHLILVGVIPCLQYLIWQGKIVLNESFSAVLFTTQNVFYPLMGYYLEHIFCEKKQTRKNCITAIILLIASVFISCFMTQYRISRSGVGSSADLQTFFSCFISICSCSVYLLIKTGAKRIQSSKILSLISVAGSSVFGVYLIEKILRSLLIFVYHGSVTYLGSFAASILWTGCVWGVGLLIVVLLKHIPYISRVVNWFL